MYRRPSAQNHEEIFFYRGPNDDVFFRRSEKKVPFNRHLFNRIFLELVLLDRTKNLIQKEELKWMSSSEEEELMMLCFSFEDLLKRSFRTRELKRNI